MVDFFLFYFNDTIIWFAQRIKKRAQAQTNKTNSIKYSFYVVRREEKKYQTEKEKSDMQTNETIVSQTICGRFIVTTDL